MPLTGIDIKPGIVKDIPSYTAGQVGPYWVDGDKVRFENGFPAKIGGWLQETTTPPTITSSTTLPAGKCRAMINWRSLNGTDFVALGTEEQLLILLDGQFYDITPLRKTSSLGANPFTTADGSKTVTVTDTGHGAATGEIVSFSNAATFNNVTIDGAYKIGTITSVNAYQITSLTAANATGAGGGSSVTAKYLIGKDEGMNNATASTALGYGTGTWGGSTWGTARSGSAVTLELTIWSLNLWGEDLIATVSNNKSYYWDASSGVATRATVISNAPITSRFTTLSFPDRHVVSMGSYDSSVSAQDPMLVAWSDQGEYNNWTVSASTTAGSQRLQEGTKIMAAVGTREEIFIGTDEAMYGMAFVGPPFTFAFRLLGTGCGPISLRSMVNESGTVYWMGRNNFFVFDGAVKELPCPMQFFIFDTLNSQQTQKIFGALNREFKEVMWFYVSNSSSDEEPDKYIIYNYEENVWTLGSMARTTWHDSFGVRTVPYAADPDGKLYNQETGTDDNGTAMTAYVESSPLELSLADSPDGTNLFMIDRVIPDATITGTVDLTLKSAPYPNGTETTKGPFTISQTTSKLSLRAKGRQMKFRFSSSAIGDSWSLGRFRINLRGDGMR
jgi:hypothetical protein